MDLKFAPTCLRHYSVITPFIQCSVVTQRSIFVVFTLYTLNTTAGRFLFRFRPQFDAAEVAELVADSADLSDLDPRSDEESSGDSDNDYNPDFTVSSSKSRTNYTASFR